MGCFFFVLYICMRGGTQLRQFESKAIVALTWDKPKVYEKRPELYSPARASS